MMPVATAVAAAPADAHTRQGLAPPTLAAIGVVCGDIGTSPLYTVKEIFAPHSGVPPDARHRVGAESTIFWALMPVVTLKYVLLILRTGKRGEGGGLALTALAPGFWQATLHFGFMDTPDVPAALALAEAQGVPVPPFETSYFLRRETVVPTPGGGMADWREKLFAAMSRNAGGVVEFFRLPGNAVVELGTRIAI